MAAAVAPAARDASAWLVYRFPRVAVRGVGRGLGVLARRGPCLAARLVADGVAGGRFMAGHLGRYVAGYRDFAPVVRAYLERDRPRRAAEVRERWRRAVVARLVGVVVALGALGVIVAGIAERYGRPGLWVVVVVVLAVLAGIGRARRRAAGPTGRSETAAGPAPAGDEAAPFPIADARTRGEAVDAVTRALSAEGVALRSAGEASRERWGWTVPVVLRSGTPDGIVSRTERLETHLDLPAGAVLASPDRTRRARVVLRLAERDPFTTLGPLPARAPGSGTIAERAVIGARIDGAPLAVPLLGVHAVVIGSSGSGKSGTLSVLAEVLTTCRDAVVWDLDPAGYGLDAHAPALGRIERDPAGITEALTDAVALARVRPRLLGGLAGEAAWAPTPERPALVVIVDEYPSLPDRAKTAAVSLLRIGRKARVTLILAATEATSDALGAAVAESAALKVLHACRHSDVRLVLGPAMAAEGWRPDRLHPATGDDLGDVGRAFVATAGLHDPLVSKIAYLDPTDARERALARAGAGRPRLDAASWAAARDLRGAPTGGMAAGGIAADTAGAATAGVDVKETRRFAAHLRAAFGDDERVASADLLARLATIAPDRYGAWRTEDLADALRPYGVAPVQARIEGRNRRGYHRDTVLAALG